MFLGRPRVGSNRTDRIESNFFEIESNFFCQFDVPRNCEYQKWLVFLNGFSVFCLFLTNNELATVQPFELVVQLILSTFHFIYVLGILTQRKADAFLT